MFRVRRREIKWKFMLSGGFADRKHTAHLASVEFCPVGAKFCAQTRCILFAKKPLLFGRRASIFMMLKRLIAKGAVTMDDSGKFQKYSAAITYSDVEPEETESFLSKVYGGSVGMMVSNLVGRGALSEQEIQELKAILDAAEK